MTGEDVREVMEAILPSDEVERWARELGVVERERKKDIVTFVRALVLAAGTPDGGLQADALRAYAESETLQVSRQAFYKWFDEKPVSASSGEAF